MKTMAKRFEHTHRYQVSIDPKTGKETVRKVYLRVTGDIIETTATRMMVRLDATSHMPDLGEAYEIDGVTWIATAIDRAQRCLHLRPDTDTDNE